MDFLQIVNALLGGLGFIVSLYARMVALQTKAELLKEMEDNFVQRREFLQIERRIDERHLANRELLTGLQRGIERLESKMRS